MKLTQTLLVSKFQCLGEACEDTCCQNWSMQMDAATLAKYAHEAPELLDAVDTEADGSRVMKRNATTRHCVKLDAGVCSIHKQKGDGFLGDACHFYPRVTRTLDAQTLMTATSSCPEIMRLALSLPAPFALVETQVERLPHTLKNYLPDSMNDIVAANVHAAFLACAMNESITPEQALARISSVARSMELLDKATLDSAVSTYLRLADGRIPKAEIHPADAFNLLHALCGLIVASHKPISPRLQKVISDMEQSLAVSLDWQNILIHLSEQSPAALTKVMECWGAPPAHYTHALRRFLALQLSLHYFPFAGLGDNPAERITFIGVRFATIKLALACAHAQQGELANEDIVRIIQSISRFLDHLGDGAFSLSIYNETGWTKEARLLALFS